MMRTPALALLLPLLASCAAAPPDTADEAEARDATQAAVAQLDARLASVEETLAQLLMRFQRRGDPLMPMPPATGPRGSGPGVVPAPGTLPVGGPPGAAQVPSSGQPEGWPQVEVRQGEGGKILLDVKLWNPIGGPTVRHYRLQPVNGEDAPWKAVYLSTTEFL